MAPPYPRGHDWTNLNLHIHTRYRMANWFLKRMLLKKFSIDSYLKTRPPLWPHPTTEYHDLKKYEYTLPENASTHDTAFLAKWFLKDFQKIFKDFVLYSTPIVAPPYPQRLWFFQTWNYTTDDFTQVSAFLNKWFCACEEDSWKIPTKFLIIPTYLSLKMVWPFFNQLESPLPKDALYQV